jgi:hypothetical protein
MKDQMLFCVQCDEPFMYSVKEQMRHQRQGFDPPRRCPECRQHKVKLGEEGGGSPKNERRGQRRGRREAEE